MAVKNWKDVVAEKKVRQKATIPHEWIISNLPPTESLNVTEFAEKCDLLSPTEIEITNSEVDLLLHNLAQGSWSAVAVTTAFAKRAVIAHQLVS
jgi:amidase